MRRLSLGLLALLLVATACGERPEPVERDLSPYPVSVRDAAGEPVQLDSEPRRIVALTMGAAELVEAVGAGERLVGVPADYVGTAAPTAARLVRPSGLVDLPRLAAVRADLVLAGSENDREGLAEALAGSGGQLYVQPDRSVPDVVRAVLELGFLVGEPVQARRVAAEIRTTAAGVERRVRGRPRVPVFVDTGFFVTPAPDSLLADLVRRAGGDLVGLEIPDTPTSACDVLTLGPEVVLHVTDAAEAGSRERAFAACEGGRTPRVVEVPADLVTAAGPRVGDALERVAQALHVDAA